MNHIIYKPSVVSKTSHLVNHNSLSNIVHTTDMVSKWFIIHNPGIVNDKHNPSMCIYINMCFSQYVWVYIYNDDVLEPAIACNL